MSPEDRKNALAAAVILLIFGGLFWFMPKIVLTLGSISPWLGGAAALLFMLSFYILFWLKGRSGRQ